MSFLKLVEKLVTFVEGLAKEIAKRKLKAAKDEALEKRDNQILEEELGGSSVGRYYNRMFKRRKKKAKRNLAD